MANERKRKIVGRPGTLNQLKQLGGQVTETGTTSTTAHACPGCGELKCLCRPRFFAGQLLSEEDLNRLDRYIMDKNRLHNRQLHGWGVVNGLEVRCHPCEDVVTVGCGYALDPCGNDIVVCEEDTVDVCELIKQCKQEEREELACKPYQYPVDCEGLEEEWVLAIEYLERPSRGITALRDGGCYNGDSSRQARRGAPAQCEPTVICEEYRYVVFRAPEKDEDPRRGHKRGFKFEGAMAERMKDCLETFKAAIPEEPKIKIVIGGDNTAFKKAWYQYCCRVKEALHRFFTQNPGYDCELIEELQCIVCPDPSLSDDAFAQQLDFAGNQMKFILYRVIGECVCRGLMPPCPEPAADNRVPLATIKIRAKDCKILGVCNWTTLRKYVTTFPNLQYWLSWLPFGRWLREALDQVCCALPDFSVCGPVKEEPQPGATGEIAYPQGVEAHVMYPQGQTQSMQESQAFVKLAMAAFMRGGRPMAISELVDSVMGKAVAGKSEAMMRLEQDNLPQFLLLNQLAAPLVGALLPDVWGMGEAGKIDLEDVLAGMSTGRESEAHGATAEVEVLKKEVSVLHEEIAVLKELIKKNSG